MFIMLILEIDRQSASEMVTGDLEFPTSSKLIPRRSIRRMSRHNSLEELAVNEENQFAQQQADESRSVASDIAELHINALYFAEKH